MWHAIFQLDVPVAEKVIRPVLIYLFLVVALRLAGKKELSQLNTLDFVVLLAVANAVQNGIIGNDSTVTGGLIGATTLFVLNALLAYLLFRNKRLQRLIEGSPTKRQDRHRHQATRPQRPPLRNPHPQTRRTEDQHRRPPPAMTVCALIR